MVTQCIKYPHPKVKKAEDHNSLMAPTSVLPFSELLRIRNDGSFGFVPECGNKDG